MYRITDKEFVYTPSYETDLGKKFREIIERQQKAGQKRPKTARSLKPAGARNGSDNVRSIGASA